MADLHAWITTEPIGADTVLALVGAERDGAAVVFLGTVRDHSNGRQVSGVTYDAYREMAERTFMEIVREAAHAVEDARIAAAHRLGELSIGEVSIAIAASTPHRAEAFEACRYVIEEAKKRLPIWKHEQYTSGDRVWLNGTVPPVPESRNA